eukprot:UN05749
MNYFDLLFRSSANINCNYNRLLQICKQRNNLVLIFHTEFDHIFSIYLKHKLYDKNEFELFLLRSHMPSEYGLCPLIINKNDERYMNDERFSSAFLYNMNKSLFYFANMHFEKRGENDLMNVLLTKNVSVKDVGGDT